MDRLLDRLQARAAQCFVGRQRELALIESALADDPPRVSVFVIHGAGGIGKTSLLEQVRRLAKARGVASLRLDARDIEPTPHGFLRALGTALELDPGDCTLGRVLERWAQGERRLLVLDTCEHLSHLEGWLRRTLLPELPDSTRVVLASRALDPDWQTDPLWHEGARVIGLGNLEPAHCERHLGARGVPEQHHAQIVQLSRGHPLAMTLLSDVVLATGQVPDALGPDLVRQLAGRFTAQAESDMHRRALEVCAHARVTTESLLAETVDRAHSHALFEWLAGLSFIETSAAGLFPHDLVRDAIDDELYWRDRARHRETHVAVRRYLIARAQANEGQAAAHTFDILYLHRRSPVMQPFVDYGSLGSMMFERAGADDLPALRALAHSELPAAQLLPVERWFSHPAVQTWAIRPAPGELAGATLVIDLALLGDKERASEPVFSAVWDALERAGTMRPGDCQLLARWNLAAGGQRKRSAAMNALQMSQFYQWLTNPRLGSFIICVEHPQHWAPMMTHIGFAELAGCRLEFDGLPLGCYAHDWRSEPLAEWLEVMADREIGEEAAGRAAPPRLSRAEFEQSVRDALRAYAQPAALASNPLLATPLVTRSAAQPGDSVATLRSALLEAAQGLRSIPRNEKFWRALELTYFRPAGSQELAAERLGLPFGTYRYQLAVGVERVVEVLWGQAQH
ncbi:ATP-binding protein [Ramlibacter solisilvae]|uniref:Uncharacterized protein n=1 Tax=Ramlibacter tataouinensis TaxID=94132 RepID=A0A127JXM2_9BURK|nr:ATP-binding protein [Ramlibacter tataouinensis]AMO24645.1 hypothetical protein UC35_19660 [Ramlibacter tataouinensis]